VKGSLPEGAALAILVNAYERNHTARMLCIKHYGSNCFVCGLDFETLYGPRGKGFIHVHHVIPLSQIKDEYLIDPIADLRPDCPNCHAMIHRFSETATCEEIRSLLGRTSKAWLHK
jgi:5-methylcytosine-specific restriction enzyme A